LVLHYLHFIIHLFLSFSIFHTLLQFFWTFIKLISFCTFHNNPTNYDIPQFSLQWPKVIIHVVHFYLFKQALENWATNILHLKQVDSVPLFWTIFYYLIWQAFLLELEAYWNIKSQELTLLRMNFILNYIKKYKEGKQPVLNLCN